MPTHNRPVGPPEPILSDRAAVAVCLGGSPHYWLLGMTVAGITQGVCKNCNTHRTWDQSDQPVFGTGGSNRPDPLWGRVNDLVWTMNERDRLIDNLDKREVQLERLLASTEILIAHMTHAHGMSEHCAFVEATTKLLAEIDSTRRLAISDTEP